MTIGNNGGEDISQAVRHLAVGRASDESAGNGLWTNSQTMCSSTHCIPQK